jgi:hypothetical protein
MTDDVLFVPDFADYRILEAEKGVKIIRQMMHDKVSPERFMGAMEMLKGIIRIPNDVAKTKEAQAQADSLTNKMFAQVEASLLRKYITEDDSK